MMLQERMGTLARSVLATTESVGIIISSRNCQLPQTAWQIAKANQQRVQVPTSATYLAMMDSTRESIEDAQA